jgi:hypothetical protein
MVPDKSNNVSGSVKHWKCNKSSREKQTNRTNDREYYSNNEAGYETFDTCTPSQRWGLNHLYELKWTTVAQTSRFFKNEFNLFVFFYLSNEASFFVSTIIPTKSTSQFVHHWSK